MLFYYNTLNFEGESIHNCKSKKENNNIYVLHYVLKDLLVRISTKHSWTKISLYYRIVSSLTYSKECCKFFIQYLERD